MAPKPSAAGASNALAKTGSRAGQSATATAGLQRRRHAAGGASGGSGKAGGSGMIKIYTDDVPGLKISPVAVLVMSLCFIGFVAILHAVSKIYSWRNSSA